jgi:plastocyanin
MRGIRLSLIATIVVLVVAVTASMAMAATRSVGVRKSGATRYLFTPSSLTISRGDTVRWSWRGTAAHNVAGPGFRSRVATRLTYSRTFRRAGTFRVVCQIHQTAGQRMTIRVQ